MEIDSEYLVLQTEYHKLNHAKNNLFPNEWYNVKEYYLKKRILRDCITNNILIEESRYYNAFREIALN